MTKTHNVLEEIFPVIARNGRYIWKVNMNLNFNKYINNFLPQSLEILGQNSQKN